MTTSFEAKLLPAKATQAIALNNNFFIFFNFKIYCRKVNILKKTICRTFNIAFVERSVKNVNSILPTRILFLLVFCVFLLNLLVLFLLILQTNRRAILGQAQIDQTNFLRLFFRQSFLNPYNLFSDF